MNPRGQLEKPGDESGGSSEEKGCDVIVAVVHNRGDRASFVGSESGRVIVRPPHCVTVTSMHGFVYCIFII